MKCHIIVFDPKQNDWDVFRRNGETVYFKSEQEAQEFGDTCAKSVNGGSVNGGSVNGRVFRQGDWQCETEEEE